LTLAILGSNPKGGLHLKTRCGLPFLLPRHEGKNWRNVQHLGHTKKEKRL
jgi:hypothetical protein